MKTFKQFRVFLSETKEPWTDPNQVWTPEKQPKTLEAAKAIYQRAAKIAADNADYLYKILKAAISGANAAIKMNIKKEEKFANKVLLRFKNPGQIHDVLRAAIISSDDTVIDRAVKYLKTHTRVNQYEYKKFGQDPKYGYYGSHHFDIWIKAPQAEQGIIVEVQVMSRRLWTMKDVAHELYEKWREVNISNPSADILHWFFDDSKDKMIAELEKDMKQSKAMFLQGNRYAMA